MAGYEPWYCADCGVELDPNGPPLLFCDSCRDSFSEAYDEDDAADERLHVERDEAGR